jgi:hypothetical protein
MAEKKGKQINNLQMAGIRLNNHTWFISKYSKKYNTEIVVFNPFRWVNKKPIRAGDMALNHSI